MKINSFDKTDASEMGHVLLQDGGGNDYYAYDSIGGGDGNDYYYDDHDHDYEDYDYTSTPSSGLVDFNGATAHVWLGSNEHMYVFLKEKFNWVSADMYASGMEMYLAVLETQQEASEVSEHVLANFESGEISQTYALDGGSAAYAWLGATDSSSEGSWVWVNGDSLSTTRAEWGAGPEGTEPDNYFGDQNYLALGLSAWPYGSEPGQGIGSPGQWNDISGDNLIYSIFEIEPSSVNYDLFVSRFNLSSSVDYDGYDGYDGYDDYDDYHDDDYDDYHDDDYDYDDYDDTHDSYGTSGESTYFSEPDPGTYQLTVIADVFGTVLLLKDLTESVTADSHMISYNGIEFNYSEIDGLITTVVRDGEFTEEFAAEIAESYPSVAGISYSTAVGLVGSAAIDDVLLMVANADGSTVT